MFNQKQWLTIAALYFLGVVIYVITNSTTPTSGHIAGGVGYMIPALLIGLTGGVIGRKRSEQGATAGIVIGFVIALALMTTDYWL